MRPPIKSSKQSEEPDMVSNNLWVGSLAGDVTDADLMSLFEKHGPIDSITTYSSRSYAFVHFKRAEDAKIAKDTLQGAVLRGNALKIEFAKPAKQCKSLWVGGISASVTKEELEEQFLKFGKMQEFKFFRDRNTAFVDYLRLEDATEALKNLNGKRIGDDQIRVDYLRSHPSRREQLPDFRDAREGQFLNRGLGITDSLWMPQDFLRNNSEPAQYGSNRPQHFQSSGGLKGDGQPSNVLWVYYPPSFPMDERMLHNTMILFGEIERIRSFPSTNYSFVKFRSVEEAQRAKEGLQGQLFNDPRIIIMYSNGELALSKDQSVFYSGIRGPRPDMFLNNIPFQPEQMDIYSHNHSIVQNSFPGHLPLRGVTVPDMLRRPLGPQGRFGHLLPGPEFNDLANIHKLQDSNPNILVGAPNQKRLSSVPEVLSSPSPGMKPSRPVSGAWDVFYASQLQRESKRSRTVGPLDTLDPSLQKMDGRLDQFYGHGPQIDSGLLGAQPNVRGTNHFIPVDARIVSGGTGQGHPELDYMWRGVIAKVGTHVCRARCVPVKIEFGFEIPEIVNCSARTGLDLLAKHYGDAIGFNIIFFLPDSVDDFAPYTEFLRYLGAKNRAGVAKFDDGITLFLVPPSDFLAKVLHVSGPERLYGVVLKFSQHAPGSTSQHPHLANQQFIDITMMPPRTENSMMPQEERVLQTDYNRNLENPNPPPKSMGPSSSNSSELDVQPISTAAISQSGVSLTPELIATLASLLPTNGNLSGAEPVLLSSKLRPVLIPAATDRGQPQGWKQEQPVAPEQNGHPLDQAGNQYNPQGLFPSQLHYSVVSNTASDSNQFQDLTFNMPQHGGPSKQITTIAEPSQSRQFAISAQFNQQYKVTQEESQHGYGQGFVTLSHRVHDATVSQQHIGIPVACEHISLEPQNQVQAVQQLQSVLSGGDPGTTEVELDKNECYRSALQLAANLILQVRKQHPDSEAAQGSGNY